MTEMIIKNKIESELSRLLDMGFEYIYSENNGILNDRKLLMFNFDNYRVKRRVLFVYCDTLHYKRLYGFMINYADLNPTIIDYENLIPFNRLKCMLDENETKFFGSEQFELDFQLKEFDKLIQKFQNELTTEDWIDFLEMEKREESIYVLQRRHGNEWWLNDFKKELKKQSQLKIKYDYSVEMPYETYGIRVENKYGLDFHITHGQKTRDDTVYLVEIYNSGQEIDKIEFENMNAESIIKYIDKK